MTDQDITFTLPLTSQEFWVLVIAASVIGLSILTFRLGHTRHQANTPSEKWLTSALTVFSGILAPLWAALIVLVIHGLWRLAWSFPSLSDGTDLRWHVLSLVGLLTALGGLLGTPLALIRITLTERQTNATEQGLITDRITKAVEGLGIEKTTTRIGRVLRVKRAQKRHIFVPDGEALQINAPLGYQTLETRHDMWFDETEGDYLEGETHVIKLLSAEETIIEWQDQGPQDLRGAESIEVGNWEPFNETVPNLEVRIGALFSLERISQDSARDHVQIMEILCAYIRNNADRDSPTLPDEDPPEGWREWGKNNRTHPPLDVDTALKIIERRRDDRKKIEKAYNDGEGYRLGLERAPLHALDLNNRDLTGADLSNAQLQGTNLNFTKLQGTNLREVKLQGADLNEVKLQGANLREAKLQVTNLVHAKLQRADLRFAKMQGAEFWYAELQGANLNGAEFDSSTQPFFADFTGSTCCGVNFSGCGILMDQLRTAFGDAHTILLDGKGPDSPDWPDHWPKEKLDWFDLEPSWRAWQAEIGFQPDENP